MVRDEPPLPPEIIARILMKAPFARSNAMRII
jgi:hypothetical protein